ncbi:MAG TPA: YihY family inner membrane protein [Casimicrobiaceae bacterium]|nr:YihY family inner membrane protein [Casimicrobiaceae bacterium]
MSEVLRSIAWFIGRITGRVRAAGVSDLAASLSFTTVLGVVPLFTVLFAYVSRFPMFQSWLDALEPILLRSLLPESTGIVRHYLKEFTARTAELQGVSTVFVIVTAVLLVAEVERDINLVWGVRTSRSLLHRAVAYALGFLVGGVAVAAAVRFTLWGIEQSLAAVPIASQALLLLARPLQIGIGTAVLTLIYLLVPVPRVPLRAALIAGLLAAIAFDIAKFWYAFYMVHLSTYQITYGALAALPLFLVWVYVSWLIVLVGAAVAATLAEGRRAESR